MSTANIIAYLKPSCGWSNGVRAILRKYELDYQDRDIINDPEIDLQAISWSVNADKRMAIINGKICREKDRVGKYVIVSINANDVLVSSGSVTGRLVFEIR